MSQAYKELDKMDIIDVINNVGNNYSIATDELSRALQRSASALKTAGNDIYESTALVTAGNAVVQDAESVGTGMQTIALRLTGTKEAAEQLEELGEDSEGVVTTISKLRDTILSASKVSSNGFKGFDILDENGNYKSTYEIMLGLSKIYKEIEETDKKMGNNNLNLLLETLAGKRRANIAASILQNPEILENVYNSAKDSNGSAQEELDKYLDSIEGKLQQLSNSAQEFWYNLINSDTVKGAIDGLIKLLNGLNYFIEKFGSFPLVITAGFAGLNAFVKKNSDNGGGRAKIYAQCIIA